MRTSNLALALLLATACSIQAATFTVSHDGLADFYSIQEAVDFSLDGDTVIVKPGVYQEDVYMDGRAITLQSENPADANVARTTFINGFVMCYFAETPATVVTGLTIGGDVAIAGGRTLNLPGTVCMNPAISGDIVVWQQISPSGMDSDIWGMNLQTGQRFAVCVVASNQQNPAISDGRVVWEDDRNGAPDIYGKNLTSGTEFIVCSDPGWTKMHPTISGSMVAWADNRSGTFAIYSKNLDSGGETLVTSTANDKDHPWLYHGAMVWQDWVNPANQSDIHYMAGWPVMDYPITALPGSQQMPRLYKPMVVWEDWGSGYPTVQGMNLDTLTYFTVSDYGYSPAVDANHVVWVQQADGKTQVRLKNLDYGAVMNVSPFADYISNPAISGQHIVWVQGGNIVLGPSLDMLFTTAFYHRYTDIGVACMGSSPTVTNNNIVACSSSGIFCDSGAPEITGNLMRECSYGVYGSLGDISENTIDQSASAGLAFCNGQVTANTITSSYYGATSCSGTISGNTISGGYIGLMDCSGAISGNTVSHNSSVAVESCSGPVTGNIITGNEHGVQSCTGILIANNTIVGNRGSAINACDDSIVKNNILTNNRGYGIAGACKNSYNAFWQNGTGSFSGNYGKVGDKYVNPQFATPGYWDITIIWVDGDYHLKSKYGRWSPVTNTWLIDDVQSGCIDAGDPADAIGYEPMPNGARINMGSYGGTTQASKSATAGIEPALECVARPTADLNGDCRVNLADYAIAASEWLTCGLADQSKCW
jgi:beta propeller repeat protein